MASFRSTLKSSTALVDLTPLVDVIFLLLIFFIVTSDILPLKSFNVENPVVQRQSTPLTTQLLVVMDAHHVIYLGSKKQIVEMEELKDRLLGEVERIERKEPDSELAIVLSVDRRVEYGAFLRLFSLAHECGKKVRLVYRTGEGRGQS